VCVAQTVQVKLFALLQESELQRMMVLLTEDGGESGLNFEQFLSLVRLSEAGEGGEMTGSVLVGERTDRELGRLTLTDLQPVQVS
jgi:hypothetical protein